MMDAGFPSDSRARAAFDAAARCGVQQVEFAFVDSASTRVVVAGGVVESLEERHDQGLGVRVWREGRQGFAFTSDASAAALARTLETARDLASFAAPDPVQRPPSPSAPASFAPRNRDPALAEFPLQRKIQLAHDVESSARAFSPEVDRVRKAMYRDLDHTMQIANSEGLATVASLTRAWLSIEAVAQRGADQRTAAYADWALGPTGLAPERVGRTGAARAMERLGARPGPTRRAPLVLHREVTAALLEALSPAFSGLRALRGRTVLQDQVGRQIGAAHVTLVDDATLDGAWGATPVDGEGQTTRRLTLVESGVMRGVLHDCYTARRFGVAPTGHALRPGYDGPPGIGAHALHLRPTGETAPELLARAGDGLFITELMGLHTVNPTTGEFSLGAVGREILPGGELGGPVDQIAISGSIFSLLGAFEAVADDLEFLIGGAGGATVLLAEAPVSGAAPETKDP